MDMTDVNDSKLGRKLEKDDEIQDLKDSKQREHNTKTLLTILRHENEILAKSKTQAEVVGRTLEEHLRDVEQVSDALKVTITELNDNKEKLEENVKLKGIYGSQIAKEVENTKKMLDIGQKCNKEIKKSYESKLAIVSNLETAYKNKYEQYITQKEGVKKIINKKKMEVISIEDKKEKQLLLFETEMNKEMYDLQTLKDKNEGLVTSIENSKIELSNLEQEYNSLLVSIKENFRQAQNSLTHIQSEIEEISGVKTDIFARHKIAFNLIESKVTVVKQTLEELDLKRSILMQKCGEESNKTDELEALIAKINDESSLLNTEKGEVEKRQNLVQEARLELTSLEKD